MTTNRQLAAIMFTDIMGYTRIMGENSNKALNFVPVNTEIQKSLVEKHDGQWIKEMGDGTLAKFNTAFDAVICALEIQKYARAELGAKLRIGIHLGDVTIENGDVSGDGANIAKCIEAIADPGGIYISETVEKAIRAETEIQVRYLGDLKLKNGSYAVGTYALQGIGLPPPDLKSKEKLSGKLQAEIQRRGIIRAGVTYFIVIILLLLLHYELQTIIDLPKSITILLLVGLIIGFPISLLLAWKYELSPEGFVRTSSKESWENPYPIKKRKPFTSTFIIILLVLIIVIILILNLLHLI